VTGFRRSHTVSRRDLARQARLEARSGVVDLELVQLRRELEAARPRTRADCARIPRPCLYALCRHHLAFDLTEAGGLKENFPGAELWDLAETCALDVAERGGLPLEAVGALMNITRERVRQVETPALRKLQRALEEDTWDSNTGSDRRSLRPAMLTSTGGGVAP
jgi:hypothetical protein